MEKIIYPSRLHGSVAANPSKSAMQRAVAAALLSHGVSTISNPGLSDDCRAALNVAEKLGARVENKSGQIVITGKGIVPVSGELHCGESGLGIRMFTPLAALSDRPMIISGEGSLAQRPMHLFEELLPKLGVSCRTREGKLPLEIKGPLCPADIEVDGSLSSQFLTGLLMAFGAAADHAIISVNGLKSKAYIALTLQVMAHFGVQVDQEGFKRFIFGQKQRYQAADYTVEGDWSGAAFLLAGAAISGNITIRALQKDSLQPDRAMLQVLDQAGALVSSDSDGIAVTHRNLQAFSFDATDCPDLFPPLVALAAQCEGTTTIKGVSRLTHKESDRGKSLRQEFATLGIDISLKGDEMEVTGSRIQPATVSSHGDHRIAMACAIAALAANGPVRIQGAESVNKSYPEFWDHLKILGAHIE
jgi:3-phosphoshikimate 1-carboxyvinyltransferase